MKRSLSIASLLFLLAGGVSAQSPDAPAPSATPDPAEVAKKLAATPMDDLISKLQEESQPSIGAHPTAWVSGFMGIDDEPKFEGGILGSEKPATSPVMHELVRRGVTALPALIAHLNDARPTKYTVSSFDGIGACWFDDEYDARYTDPKKQPPGVNASRGPGLASNKTFDKYTLKVGDYCYVAIGQIVNRDLHAVRYVPSGCLAVDSPVENPALAAAVKADWGGLTAEEHRKSLEHDYNSGAVERLSLYYPETSDPLAVKILSRPFYDYPKVYNFFPKEFVSLSAEKQDQLLANFRKKEGEANYQGLLREILTASSTPEEELAGDKDRLSAKKVADGLLRRDFPGIDASHLPFIDAVNLSDEKMLVESLQSLRSKAIDDAVAGILQRASELPRDDNLDHMFEVFDLADTCAQRLAPQPEYQKAVSASLEKIIGSMQGAVERAGKSPAAYNMDQNTKTLQELLAKLQAKPADAPANPGKN